MSKYDIVYKSMVEDILNNGTSDKNSIVRTKWDDGTPAYTLSVFGVCNKYDLSEEFPIQTTRPTFIRQPWLEMEWMWIQKSNDVSWLQERNCHIWDSWVDKNNTLGTGYAHQLAKQSEYKEGNFDQVDKVIYDLKYNPLSRSIMTNMYNHEDLNNMTLRPCAYSCTFNVSNGKLNMILNQRSSDLLTANNWNVVQYSLLMHSLAQVSNLKVGTLTHMIGSLHLYDRHIELVEGQIQRPMHDAPTLTLDTSITNFYDFNINSFKLHNYKYEPNFKIPVAI